MNFNEIKEEILFRAENNNACEIPLARAKAAEDADALLEVVKENFSWVWHRKVVDLDLLLAFGEESLWKNKIYTGGEHNIEVDRDSLIITLGSSQVTVTTLGSSQATVETRESSQATVTTLGSSQATVETRESSHAKVTTYGASHATVKTFGSSQATVKTFGSSQATVETFGSSHATVKTFGASQATVETWDSSQATVTTRDSSILRNLTTRKVFVPKNFEMVVYE